MQVNSLTLKSIVTPIIQGSIRGQGDSKKYIFLIMETDEGIGISEIYSGTYYYKLIFEVLELIKPRILGKYISKEDISSNFLHQPFISGSGIVEVINSAIYNCFKWIELNHSYTKQIYANLIPYLSGGTVSSSLEDLDKEITYSKENSFNFIKVRIDYRDKKKSLKKIEFLDMANVNYAVDIIANTNFLDINEFRIQDYFSESNSEKIIWIEEPFFPTNPLNWNETISQCRNLNLRIALGESLTSILELDFICKSSDIDIVQLDSTHCSDINRLTHLINCNIGQKKLWGIHNWGSLFGAYQNFLMIKNIECDFYWEVPFYKTLFDEEFSEIIDVRNIHILNENPNNTLDKINKLIIEYPSREYKDFNWT